MSMTRNGVPEPSTETRTAWLEKSRPGKRVSVAAPAMGSGGVGRRGENGDGRTTMRPGAWAAAPAAAVSAQAATTSATRRIAIAVGS